MMGMYNKKAVAIICGTGVVMALFFTISIERVNAGSYDGIDLAHAILVNDSWLISSSYSDTDSGGHRQGVVLSSLGILAPTDGSTFALLSTGIAGMIPVTSNGEDPGSERGEWFSGGQYGYPRDEAELTMTLLVPPFMHYLYYDVQFFSSEYPEYVGSQYNDKFTVIVDSPSQGTTTFALDVNSGNFVLDSHYILGTGFDIFARSGDPDNVDYVDTVPRTPGADAGATALVTHGGEFHPVSPEEQITVTFGITDVGDNQFDSAVFIDNLMFSGYAKTDIMARKTAQDLNGEPVECGDIITYSVTLSNIGGVDQPDNPGNEFEDAIPENSTYVPGSATATTGSIVYDPNQDKIIWNGNIPKESSVALTFKAQIDTGLENGHIISNQGTIYWDSDEDGTNDAEELTDNPNIDDGIDMDGDGETNDDDPTNLVVVVFEPPSSVTEDFSDDTAGDQATQSYCGRQWFETSHGVIGSSFKVASGYQQATANSFKTKIRSTGSPQYWNYSLTALNSDIEWWEVWFACGNASEGSDLLLKFVNTDGATIAKIKFGYIHAGTEFPLNWLVKLTYWSPSGGWTQLNTNAPGGYLYNDWYKLKIQRNESNYIDYRLYQSGSLVDYTTDGILDDSFSHLARIEWSNSKLPIVSPMFFWDDHTIGLNQI
jgi:uncharacterized repeat protein (TIGR01451 family)